MTDGPDEPRSDDGPLASFIALAVADDYGSGGRSGPVDRSRGTTVVAVAIALVIGLIGAIAITAARSADDVRTRTHDELEQRVSALTGEVDSRRTANDELAAQVRTAQEALLDDEALAAQAAQADRLAAATGMAALAGPGVTVTIGDAPGARADSLNRVLDRDLQLIVNALWKMGATGIAINGQRLTAATAIRAAGDAILVDYRPLVPPYPIDAIGTSSTDPGENDLTSLLDALEAEYGLPSSIVTGDVALPPGELRAPHLALVEPKGSPS